VCVILWVKINWGERGQWWWWGGEGSFFVKAEGKLSWMSEIMMTEVTFVNKVSQRLLSKIVVHCWAILQFGRFS